MFDQTLEVEFLTVANEHVRVKKATDVDGCDQVLFDARSSDYFPAYKRHPTEEAGKTKKANFDDRKLDVELLAIHKDVLLELCNLFPKAG